MGSVNRVILVGNLGKDPELRATSGGASVANFSIATTSKFKRDDKWEEQTEWHRIVVWGKMAENCAQYLSKGRQVYIEGRLQTRQWEDRDGNTRYTTEVVAGNVVFLGSKDQGGRREEQAPDDSYGPGPDDDVPF